MLARDEVWHQFDSSLPCLPAQPVRRCLQCAFDAIAARAFPGCAFGVWPAAEVVLEGALGRFTYEEDSPAVSAETVLRRGQPDQGRGHHRGGHAAPSARTPRPGEPLGELLPGFVVGRAPGDRRTHVKLRHLLAHNSGLPGYVEFFRTVTTPAALVGLPRAAP